MREITLPPLVEVATDANLTDLVVQNAIRAPHRIQFRRRIDDRWEDVTSREFLAEVDAVAKGLVARGVQPGDRIGLMSRTRYEWTLADFAIWSAGAVPVPIYETSSAEQVEWILGDAGAVGVVVETATHAAMVAQVRGELAGLAHVWVLDEDAVPALVEAGAQVPDEEIAQRRRSLTPESVATIIYTSGTTGRPKGCELTHGNFLSDTYNAIDGLGEMFDPNSSTLLFLPLAHVFARVIQLGCVYGGVTMGHSPDTTTLLDDLAEFRPTFILSVPRVFEKVYNGAQAKAAADGKGRIFDRAAGVAVAYSEALDSGGPGLGLRAQHALFDRLVYSKLRARLGGRAQWAVSGGAPLGARLGHFFRGIGMTICEGYGLTETSAAATLNTPTSLRIGTVGRPLGGISLRIADDGEVMIKGAPVFRGYWNNETATKEAIEADGWFHSGDIGELDHDGFLSITGRKKELIVTAGGKNVAPAVLEDRLRAHPLVSQCIVIGDNRPYIAALVTLDRESLPAWLGSHGRPADLPVTEAATDPEVHAAVQAAVDDANAAVSKAEAIKRFTILVEDFTEEGGQLTPTMKLKRAVVLSQFAADVEALYT